MLLGAGDQRDLYAWIEKAAAPICDAEPGVMFPNSSSCLCLFSRTRFRQHLTFLSLTRCF